MQNNRFVVLTGHLSNYPLSDLVGILRHQKKSGRLLIEYPKGPATLFFENGELVDVRLNDLTGLQAICVLLSQPDASFNFNPLIRSSQRSIDRSMQRVVSELFGCWDESAIQIEAGTTSKPLELQADTAPREVVAIQGPVERLALPPAQGFSTKRKSFYVIAATVLIVVAISTVIALTANLNHRETESTLVDRNGVAPPVENASPNKLKASETSNRAESGRTRSFAVEQRRDNRSTGKRAADSGEAQSSTVASNANPETKSQSIQVVMQLENGRVQNASIANHAAGMDNFEALALRIARQRRYAAGKNGNETVTISVDK